VTHDGEERSDQREQRARQGQGAHARHEGLGTPGGHAGALLAQERADTAEIEVGSVSVAEFILCDVSRMVLLSRSLLLATPEQIM
jgi:hypothetical protein